MSVVVTYAGSPESEVALSAAAEEAVGRRLPLLVADLAGSDDSAFDRIREKVIGAGGSVEVRAVDREDDTVEQVLAMISERHAALLVIGLRQRTPVGKLILGSSAQRLLLDATCPVLAVKP